MDELHNFTQQREAELEYLEKMEKDILRIQKLKKE